MTTSQSENSRVAVVTGGARGIGLAIGKWFLEHGYQLALLDIDQKTLDATMQTFSGSPNVIGIHCDVSELQQVQSAAQKITQTFGHVNVISTENY